MHDAIDANLTLRLSSTHVFSVHGKIEYPWHLAFQRTSNLRWTDVTVEAIEFVVERILCERIGIVSEVNDLQE